MHHQSFLRYAAVALACSVWAFSSGDTFAGQKFTTGAVTILSADPSGPPRAFGSIGGARNSSDSVQQIGCSSSFDGTNHSGTCTAKGAGGTVLTCATTNPTFIAQIRSISSQSSISFGVSTTGGCSGIGIGVSSGNDVPVN